MQNKYDLYRYMYSLATASSIRYLFNGIAW